MTESIDSKKLLIYGYGGPAKEFISAANRYGFEIVAIYSEKELNFFRNKNIETNKTKFLKIAKSSKLPIVITNLDSDHSKLSKDILHIRNKLELTNHILHPVFLCDYYQSIHTRYHMRGFPGSGNMIFQNILDRIVRSNKISNMPSPDPLHPLMERYALWYWYSLTHNLEQIFDSAEVERTISIPKYMRTAAFALLLKRKKETGIIYSFLPQFDGLPCRSYVWSNPWGGEHSPLTTESIDFFQSQKFINIQIVRHPLDVLVSNANKIVISDNYTVDNIINNESWFIEMLTQIVKYYELIVENKNQVCLIKYEDFMDNPILTIQNFSNAIGVVLSESECKEIFEDIDGKKISSYWKPGYDKWKKYIPAKYKDIIYQSGIVELTENLGYQIDINQLQEKEIDKKEDCKLNDIELYWLAVKDIVSHRSNVGKKVTFMHQDLIVEKIKGTNIHVTCAKPDFDRIVSFFSSDLSKDLIKASSLKPTIQSIDAYDYFQKN